MNHETDDIPQFDDPAQEREWLAQENALRRERLHLDPAGDDARSHRYRLLARTLRTAPPDGLPADFAQQVSAMAGMPAHEQASSMALEGMLTTVLASVLLLAAATVTIIYGSAWWPSFKALLPAPAATQWLLALAGCLGMSWLLGAWSRRAGPLD
ncbi:hypothetical protein ACPPVV_16630 [Rhodanobacter sp. Col0626]|uniref:hypothetical protein n=1 Tax=Rhodanobacter sp. Col0626 TaxID=3415679 RepID=UPI003CF798DA